MRRNNFFISPRRLVIAVLPCAFIVCSASAQPNVRKAIELTGITPTAMTVAGLSASDVAGYFASLQGSQELAVLLSVEQQVAMAEEEQLVALETCDPFEVVGAQTLLEAELEVVAARQAFAVAADSVLAKAGQELTQSQQQRLSAWRRAAGGLPPEFRIVGWSESELRGIQAALLGERLVATAGLPAKTGAAAILAEARSRPDVADAAMRLGTMLPEISAAFEQASY